MSEIRYEIRKHPYRFLSLRGLSVHRVKGNRNYFNARSSLSARRRIFPVPNMDSEVLNSIWAGTLQADMDADVVVFDLDRIKANATYENPRTPSSGMRYVMVGGQFIISDGKLLTDVRPGHPLRGPVC
jgi:N-acyl-D-aspartate/D-glutamate deacylase